MGALLKTIKRYSGWKTRAFIAIKNKLILPLGPIHREVPKRGNICELGSGLGMVSIYLGLKEKGRKITGYELSRTRVKTANEAAKGMENVNFIAKDLRKEQDIGKFKTFLLVDFFHHVPYETQEEILEFICKSKGTIILKEIDKGFGIKYSLNFLCDKFMTRMDDLWFRSGDQWGRLLKAYGYSVKRKKIQGVFPHTILIAKK